MGHWRSKPKEIRFSISRHSLQVQKLKNGLYWFGSDSRPICAVGSSSVQVFPRCQGHVLSHICFFTIFTASLSTFRRWRVYTCNASGSVLKNAAAWGELSCRRQSAHRNDVPGKAIILPRHPIPPRAGRRLLGRKRHDQRGDRIAQPERLQKQRRKSTGHPGDR